MLYSNNESEESEVLKNKGNNGKLKNDKQNFVSNNNNLFFNQFNQIIKNNDIFKIAQKKEDLDETSFDFSGSSDEEPLNTENSYLDLYKRNG